MFPTNDRLKQEILINTKQGLEGYFRDPGFDQNMTRDLGKRKISWREMGFDWNPGSGFTKIWARDAGFFPISVGKPGNRDD